MRWMWIDRVVSLTPGVEIVAVKHVCLSEDYLAGQSASAPVMPASLVIEGMAQAAGLLVGHASGFREKVVLAKISRANFLAEAAPGCTIWHTARIVNLDGKGAATSGAVEVAAPGGERRPMGAIDLIFSHLDQSGSGLALPEENFVFGAAFQMLLRTSGLA